MKITDLKRGMRVTLDTGNKYIVKSYSGIRVYCVGGRSFDKYYIDDRIDIIEDLNKYGDYT